MVSFGFAVLWFVLCLLRCNLALILLFYVVLFLLLLQICFECFEMILSWGCLYFGLLRYCFVCVCICWLGLCLLALNLGLLWF